MIESVLSHQNTGSPETESARQEQNFQVKKKRREKRATLFSIQDNNIIYIIANLYLVQMTFTTHDTKRDDRRNKEK